MQSTSPHQRCTRLALPSKPRTTSKDTLKWKTENCSPQNAAGEVSERTGPGMSETFAVAPLLNHEERTKAEHRVGEVPLG